jgi:hypothetical protein
MRMRNPFASDPEDERGPGDDPLSPPEQGREESSPEASTEEPARETRVAETRAGETRAGGETPETDSDAGEHAESSSGGEETEADSGDARESSGSGEETEHSSNGSSNGSGDGGSEGEQDLTAPSVGPHTTFDKEPPEERLDHDKISDTDAMGKDKRREVVGGTYGPTKTRVLATFAAFFLVVGALTAGFYFLAKELDQPPSENPDVAPWSAPDAPQQPPRELQ